MSQDSRVAPKAGVALIGLGHWGKNLFRNLVDLGALVAVCDQDPKSLANRLAEHPGLTRVAAGHPLPFTTCFRKRPTARRFTA